MEKKKLYWIGAAILGLAAIVGGVMWYRKRSGITAGRKADRNINIERIDV
jgi:uncharacterized protein YqhQ